MDKEKPTVPGLNPKSPEEGRPCDPEDRRESDQAKEIREKMMDKTLADSFPSSDPPSTIPDPEENDSYAA